MDALIGFLTFVVLLVVIAFISAKYRKKHGTVSFRFAV